jgi:hypothetical protein
MNNINCIFFNGMVGIRAAEVLSQVKTLSSMQNDAWQE